MAWGTIEANEYFMEMKEDGWWWRHLSDSQLTCLAPARNTRSKEDVGHWTESAREACHDAGSRQGWLTPLALRVPASARTEELENVSAALSLVSNSHTKVSIQQNIYIC